MRTSYDPWGRAAPRRQSVPLDTALALRDRADQALQALEQCRQDLGAAERQARSLREALDASRAAHNDAEAALREALAEARARAEEAEQRVLEAERLRPQPLPNAPSLEPEFDHGMEAAVASLRADLANVRRHQQEAVERARRDGRAELLLPLLDTLDDLRRARDGADAAVAQGFAAMDKRLVHRLEAAGGQVFGAQGEAFDPERHEAIGTGAGPFGQVLQVVGHGLVDDVGAVLRPARVLVGDGTNSPSRR